MPERRFLQQGSAAVQIETTSAADGATAIGPEIVRAVREIAQLFGEGIGEMEKKPEQVEISFGLRVAGDGTPLISLDPPGGNFAITLGWGGRLTPPVDLPIPEPE